jgi:hypothetical protein
MALQLGGLREQYVEGRGRARLTQRRRRLRTRTS